MPETMSAADRGFTMPAEWEKQRAVLLSWPLNPVTWEDRRAALETTYAGNDLCRIRGGHLAL